MKCSKGAQQTGFTLVELMVALAIMVIVSAIALQVFSYVANTREDLNRQQKALQDVQFFMRTLETDLQFLAKPERDQLALWPIWLGNPSDAVRLAFIRDVTTGNQPTRYQRIEYRLEDDQLIRVAQAWPVNPQQAGASIRTTLLKQTDQLQFALYFPLIGWLDDAATQNNLSSNGNGSLLMPTGVKVLLWLSPPSNHKPAKPEPIERLILLNKP
jgi:general secretion pathway protein J